MPKDVWKETYQSLVTDLYLVLIDDLENKSLKAASSNLQEIDVIFIAIVLDEKGDHFWILVHPFAIVYILKLLNCLIIANV